MFGRWCSEEEVEGGWMRKEDEEVRLVFCVLRMGGAVLVVSPAPPQISLKKGMCLSVQCHSSHQQRAQRATTTSAALSTRTPYSSSDHAADEDICTQPTLPDCVVMGAQRKQPTMRRGEVTAGRSEDVTRAQSAQTPTLRLERLSSGVQKGSSCERNALCTVLSLVQPACTTSTALAR